jgi:F-type H+-transporting ATPase subunit gamma
VFKSPELILFGRKAKDFFSSRGRDTSRHKMGLKPSDVDDVVADTIAELVARYQGGELDEVYLAYNTFVNTLKQEPTIEKLFPLVHLAEQAGAEPEHLVDFVYEPSQAAILGAILPLFLRTRMTQVFLESEAGEHAARMTAMDSATRNAKEVIDRLTLEYNRARQAYITKELVEIVAGAEAL